MLSREAARRRFNLWLSPATELRSVLVCPITLASSIALSKGIAAHYCIAAAAALRYSGTLQLRPTPPIALANSWMKKP